MSKEKFFRLYANLPINIRKEIIAVVDDEPITWNVANQELSNNTKLGDKILKQLEDLKIIELVIKRIAAMPANLVMSMGVGELDKNAMISHIESNDAIGKKIVKMHLFYLQSISKQYNGTEGCEAP